MNLLITGIHGFIGSNLVIALKDLHAIYGLDIISPEKAGILNTYRWNELDQIQKADVIIHLAGKAHDTNNTTEDQTYFDINVRLTEKIFDFFLKSNASRFIFFSSVKSVADSLEEKHLTEHVNPNPSTSYGKSKLKAEIYLLSQKIPEYKTVYILRPCMIHGPGNKGNLNQLYNVVSTGIPWPLGAFENRRSFTSIDNLNFIIKRIIDTNIEQGTYHIADDEPLSTNRLVELMAESKGQKARIWKPRKSIINGLARVGDQLHLPLNSDRLKKLTESYVVSNEKLKQALGVEKLPVTAEEGLRKTLASFNK